MPHLEKLMDRGTSGYLCSLTPMLSPVLWNSIATGKTGDVHGVLGFMEPDPDGGPPRPVASTSRRVKALWNLLSQLGKRSVVVNWFASHPAEPIAGAVVSGHYADSALHEAALPTGFCHPPELREDLETLLIRPSDLTPAQVRPFYLEQLPSDEDPLLHALTQQLAKCASTHNAATWLAETQEWDFLAVYYDMIDHCGHGFMELAGPRLEHVSEETHAVHGKVMERVYEYHDLMLGRWLEIAGEDTAVLLISDHGFASGGTRPFADPGIMPEGSPIIMERNPLAWHRLHGVFAAAGPGIKVDALVHGASLLDIAPTVLTLLGIPVPEDFAGNALHAIFDGPVEQRGPSMESPHPEDGVIRDALASAVEPWAAQAAMDQLVALGYLAAPSEDQAQMLEELARLRESVLAQILLSRGRNEESLEVLRGLLARQDDPPLRCREAQTLCAMGRFAEASPIVDQAIAEVPRLLQARLLQARISLAENRTEEAERQLQELLKWDREVPAVLLQLGATLLRLQRWSEAEGVFRRVLEMLPDEALAHDGLGVTLRQRGAVDDALFHHMRSASIFHARAQTHVNLGLAATLAGHHAWAIRAFEIASEMEPTQPYPERWLARLYFLLKDREKGRHHAARMLARRAAMGSRDPGLHRGV